MEQIIYLRVSKENEKLQDLEPQKKAIIEKFNLDPQACTILTERGSAYDLNKISNRHEFLFLIKKLFNADKTTVLDLYLSNYEKKEIGLYVWDYHRIMRNFELSLFFGLLSDFFNVKIYSYKQGRIKKKEEETPIDKFSRYIFYSINAFSSEDYSYNISTNIKKVIEKEKNITVSNKGNKWGRRFRDLEGKTIILKPEKIQALNKRIVALKHYYRKQKKQFYYQEIILKINKEFKIRLSKSYISRLLNQ